MTAPAGPLTDIAGEPLDEYCCVLSMGTGHGYYIPTRKLLEYIRSQDNWDTRYLGSDMGLESFQVSREKEDEIRKSRRKVPAFTVEQITYHGYHGRTPGGSIHISFIPENLSTSWDLGIGSTTRPVPVTRGEGENQVTQYFPSKTLVKTMTNLGWSWDTNPNSQREPDLFLPPEGPDPLGTLMDSAEPVMVDPGRDGNRISLAEYLATSNKEIRLSGFERIQVVDGQAVGLIVDRDLPLRKTGPADADGVPLHEYCHLKYVGEEPDEIEPDPDDYYNHDEMDEDGHPLPVMEYGFFVKTATVVKHIQENPTRWADRLGRLKNGRIDLPERYESAAESITGPVLPSHGNFLKMSFKPEHPHNREDS